MDRSDPLRSSILFRCLPTIPHLVRKIRLDVHISRDTSREGLNNLFIKCLTHSTILHYLQIHKTVVHPRPTVFLSLDLTQVLNSIRVRHRPTFRHMGCRHMKISTHSIISPSIHSIICPSIHSKRPYTAHRATCMTYKGITNRFNRIFLRREHRQFQAQPIRILLPWRELFLQMLHQTLARYRKLLCSRMGRSKHHLQALECQGHRIVPRFHCILLKVHMRRRQVASQGV